MDINQINKNYENIEKYLKHLDSFNFKNEKDFEERFNDYLAVSMSLFSILNSCIEIGESLIDLKKLEFPTTYRKIFTILEKEKVISKKVAEKLSDYMHERNMIAHQYDEVKITEIYSLYIKRKIFRDYIKETKKYFIK